MDGWNVLKDVVKKKERKRLLKKSYFYFFPPSIVSLRHSHWMILHHTFYIQFQYSKSMQEKLLL